MRQTGCTQTQEPAVIRTLVVDDERDIRALISITLSIESGIRVVGEAADGTEALGQWRELRPDAVVLDMRMPGLSGLDVAREMLAEDPQLTVVMCSAFMDEQDRSEAGGLGVAAHVDKLHIAQLGGVITAAHGVRGHPRR